MESELTLAALLGLGFLFVSVVLPIMLAFKVRKLGRELDVVRQVVAALRAERAGPEASAAAPVAPEAPPADTKRRVIPPLPLPPTVQQDDAPPSGPPPADNVSVGPWGSGAEGAPEETSGPAEDAPRPASGQAASQAAGHSGTTRETGAEPGKGGRKAAREQVIGARWSVWAGGITLAFGGVFLVKYAIDNGILGPGVRVLLGLLFGALLMAGGEWTRRRPKSFSVPGYESANIPAMLTAVGSLSLFASIFAAHALYGLVGPAIAFLSLGAVALLTMLAALLHGPGLAVLGLLASYCVPFLINSDRGEILPVAILVLVVSASAVAIGRYRMWLWLAGSAVAGLFLYAMGFEVAASSGDRIIVTGYLMGAIAVAYCGFVLGLHPRAPEWQEKSDRVATLALSVFALPLACNVQFGASMSGTVIEALLLIGLPVLAVIFHSSLRHVLWFPLLAGLWTVYWFGASFDVEGLMMPMESTSDIISPLPRQVGEATAQYAALLLALGVLVVGGGIYAAFRSAARASLAANAVLCCLALLCLGYLRIETWQVSVPFAVVALLLAAGFYGLSEWLAPTLRQGPGGPQSLAAWLTGAVMALALAACFAFTAGALTVALGLIMPAFTLVYLRHRLPELRVLAPFTAIPYGLRLLWDPFIAGADLGTTPVFNALLYGYGLPCAGFIFSAVVFTRSHRDRWSEALQAISIVSGVVTLGMLALHAIDPSFRFLSDESRFQASAMLMLIGGSVSLGLTRMLPGTRYSVLENGAMAISLLGMILGGLAMLVAENPLFTEADVGSGVLVNWITFGYGLPALVYGLLAFVSRIHRPRIYWMTAAAFAAALAFCFVNLTIRNLFSPGVLTLEPVGELEHYVYSFVWLAVGAGCLFYGMRRGSLLLRKASGVIIALVVLKVFLIDMSALEGVLRALSFIGLGVTLIGIGYLYQRMILNLPADAPGADAGAE
ncbi:DUF2339 domain-containing protein [Roseibium suaedae]|uniref:Uncharacterized membrane protein n=1 Tax=Roseibium suaedae TaxID=735517 RepID=A0A1M7H4V9_9HYPH|nr:DUF2339 domain-containing protein [Roseibium suaedae]SHM23289.1 Uncharacterized membrane protein [Roseibium suaedae]